jgi:FkbM family methyltransferase
VKKVNGIWMPDDDQLFVDEVERTGGFQLARLERAFQYVKNWDIAIDGGAHIGSWTKRMAQRFKQVYAFELVPETYRCLALNTAMYCNVKLFNKALSRKCSKGSVTWDANHQAQGNTGAKYYTESSNGLIDSVNIDFLELPGLGFLKLDIEGAEELALRGAEATLTKYKPLIYLEVKRDLPERFGLHKQGALHYLEQLGAREIDCIGCDYIYAFD